MTNATNGRQISVAASRPISYPDRIVLPRGPRRNKLVRESFLLNAYNEGADRPANLVLEKEYFMGGNEKFWNLMVDFLFPYEVFRKSEKDKLIRFSPDGNYTINPNFDVTIDDLIAVIDYLGLGSPDERERILLKYIYNRPGAPKMPTNEERAARKQLASLSNRGKPNENDEDYEHEDEDENENERYPELGETEENEETLAKLSSSNYKRYGKRGGKRKTLRRKRRTAKTLKRTR